jgi:hypothetical protein
MEKFKGVPPKKLLNLENYLCFQRSCLSSGTKGKPKSRLLQGYLLIINQIKCGKKYCMLNFIRLMQNSGLLLACIRMKKTPPPHFQYSKDCLMNNTGAHF